MTQLNAIIAIEKGVRSNADKTLGDAHQNRLKAPLLSGLHRSYQPKDDDGDQFPNEVTYPQVQVTDVVEDVQKALVRLFDVELTLYVANTEASADVIVEDTILLHGVPAPYLLFLEKKLVDLRTFVKELPTHDPADVWLWDQNVGSYATGPAGTIKTKKVTEPFVKWAPPTPEYKQEAQVELVSKDVVVGTWTARKFTGTIPGNVRREMLDRVDTLTEAVKVAREKANGMEVTNAEAGAAVFEYLFGPLAAEVASH